MCTVSFVPVNGSYLITSNRDEKSCRKKAIVPEVYKTGRGQRIIYPKDGDAGGSWIAMRETGEGAVLLNGAFLAHVATPPYRVSRGQIFLDLMEAESPTTAIEKINLLQIEPFTVVLLEKKSLYEFRWDGKDRHFRQLSSHQPHIWSSATLYERPVVKKREQWFASFLNRNPHPTQRDIINFHRFAGDGDGRNDLLMSRDGVYATASITSMLFTDDRGSMKYLDLIDEHITEKKIELISAAETI